MKAVLFDVYQTLLSGRRVERPDGPLREVITRFGLELDPDQSPSERLREEFRRDHARSEHSHPEVDIRDCWRRIFPSLSDPDAFALAAEQAVHPVLPMQGAREAIRRLHDRGCRLGIVSNAQAYTTPLLKEHLGPEWSLFEPSICAFSYRFGFAKPNPGLFRAAIEPLLSTGIPPEEILMIGDSPTNDIVPAQSLGIRTHLFRDWSDFRRDYDL
ncbi:FMN phosphatase YigB HAD superfamily [Haloferula helveola]|uniref:FMN phosphatase YigB HAD superfamily n=1 Tax=Haloferula helveola TaxID=490095 RepID=A0ABM7RI88_9BACT|nr:FMN phosphatase YigB HAD superfamily [Haloferula helveola]